MNEIGTVRPVDRARAARMVVAALSGDAEMFAVVVAETLDDDHGIDGPLGGMDSTVSVLRTLAEDLGAALVSAYGDRAVELVQQIILQQSAAGEAQS